MYLNVYAPDGETLLYATDETVRLTPDDSGRFDVAIPTEKLGEHAPSREVALLGDDGEERSTFEVGESLAVAAADLVPRTAYEFVLRGTDGEELFTSRLVSDADWSTGSSNATSSSWTASGPSPVHGTIITQLSNER